MSEGKGDKGGFGRRWPSIRLGGWMRGGSLRLLVGLGGAGALLIVVSSLIGTGQGPVPQGAPAAGAGASVGAQAEKATAAVQAMGTATVPVPSDPVLRYERLLEQEVAVVLDQVGGAGPVHVAITVAGSPTRVLAQNTSSSQDRQVGSGATLQSSEQDALAYAKGVPVLTTEAAPRVVGALVVARGAADPMVRAELTQAVETLLGLAANQVIVLPGR